jgi:hypothetical protein
MLAASFRVNFLSTFFILCFAWAEKGTKSFKAKTELHRCTCTNRTYLTKFFKTL